MPNERKPLLELTRRVHLKIKTMLQGRVKGFDLYQKHVHGKRGLEIGGPSGIFGKDAPLPIYNLIEALDNCDFSKATVWVNHAETFVFNDQKSPGTTIFCDGSALVSVPDDSYDLVLSAHNLEHFANPVKALKEWKRVLSPAGILVLVLPHYKETFDHQRKQTTVDHMFEDFRLETGEDDLTHLNEILQNHDLNRDKGSGSREYFNQRSLENFSNRCLHHHVFDEENSRELLERAGFKVLSIELAAPFHICILAQSR
jgi:SAM-dependent methyltransferase